MMQWTPREVEKLAQGHTARKLAGFIATLNHWGKLSKGEGQKETAKGPRRGLVGLAGLALGWTHQGISKGAQALLWVFISLEG